MAEDDCVLDRLLALAERPQESAAALKTVAARLHSKASSHDRIARSKIIETITRRNSGYLALLLSLLETVRDHAAVCSLVGVLHECCAPPRAATGAEGRAVRGGSKGARSVAVEQLVQLGGTHAVLRLTLQLVRDSGGSQQPQQQQHSGNRSADQFTHDLLWLLAHLAQRDARFPVKCRTVGAVRPLHGLLRTLGASSKLLYPLLMIIKVLARNASTAGVLVKDGAAQTMETTLASLGLSPHPRLRLCLDVINLLTRNRIFCARLSRTPTVHLLLRMLERCDHQEGGKIQLRVCAATLATLHRLCTSKPGRMVLRSHNGLQLLQAFCTGCPEERNRDALVARACDIIGLCLENRVTLLPDGASSPARFPLPVPASNLYLQGERSGSSSRDTTPNSDEERTADDEDGELDELPCEESLRSDTSAPPQPVLRDIDELQSYATFYQEMLLQRSSRFTRDSSLSDGSDDEDSVKSLRGLSLEPPNPAEVLRDLHLISKIRSGSDPRRVYCLIASKVHSVIPFVKVAYPDMVGAESVNVPEPLNVKERRVCRSKLLQCIDRGLHPEQGMRRVVYDLDALVEARRGFYATERHLNNGDENKIGQEFEQSHLLFESRFESGNLRRAVQVGPREYELMLMPDVNSTRHHQWFYFEVNNMKAGVPYTFNIVNCEKQNSQFNYGMKPLLFSVQSAVQEQLGWTRVGTDICYYRNTFQNPGNSKLGRAYLTTTFTVTFPHSRDVCYLAYHYPYPYSRLMTQIWNWAQTVTPGQVYFRAQSLCYSLNDNEVPTLTITAPHRDTSPIQERPVVVLTARVHPGESNASWVMEGALQFLLGTSERAARVREAFVFKVVPMLNPEGVINGCHRCGLTDEDLNRRWSRPDPRLHPVIFHAKGLIEYCARVLGRTPFLYCDLHGHSRRKNVFLYGCSRAASWSAADLAVPEDPAEYLLLPEVLQQTAPAFALPLCSSRVERSRESTARVALWRQLGIGRSYTLESSYCGCDQGPYQGLHLGTAHLHEVGRNLCEALGVLHEDGWRLRLLITACSPQVLAAEQASCRLAGLGGLGDDLRDETLLSEPSDSSDYDEEYHALND